MAKSDNPKSRHVDQTAALSQAAPTSLKAKSVLLGAFETTFLDGKHSRPKNLEEIDKCFRSKLAAAKEKFETRKTAITKRKNEHLAQIKQIQVAAYEARCIKSISERTVNARTGRFIADRTFFGAFKILALPYDRDDDFRARAAAMAQAVCTSGNKIIPRTLITAMFALMHSGVISAKALQITLHELLKARFASGMTQADVVAYLSIVGKTALHPDERVGCLLPLAAHLKQLQSRKINAPHLTDALELASAHWPSWRLADTRQLMAQGAQLKPAGFSRPVPITRAASKAKCDNVVTAFGSEDFPASLKKLGDEFGDVHLRGFSRYLHTSTARGAITTDNYLSMMSHVAKRLREERVNFKSCIRPFFGFLPPTGLDNRLRNGAIEQLCVIAGAEDRRDKSNVCRLALEKYLSRRLSDRESRAYHALEQA